MTVIRGLGPSCFWGEPRRGARFEELCVRRGRTGQAFPVEGLSVRTRAPACAGREADFSLDKSGNVLYMSQSGILSRAQRRRGGGHGCLKRLAQPQPARELGGEGEFFYFCRSHCRGDSRTGCRSPRIHEGHAARPIRRPDPSQKWRRWQERPRLRRGNHRARQSQCRPGSKMERRSTGAGRAFPCAALPAGPPTASGL